MSQTDAICYRFPKFIAPLGRRFHFAWTDVLNRFADRQQCTNTGVSLVLLITLLGCRSMDKIERKSIDHLYAEAVTDAANRADANRQMNFLPTESIIENDDSAVYEQEPPLPFGSNLVIADEGIGLPGTHATRRTNASVSMTSTTADTGPQKPISETFEQTDIREAIQILASLAEVSVIVDDSVGGVTSATIEDATFEQSLEQILLPVGLVYAKHGNNYVIAPPDPDSPLFDYISQRNHYVPEHHQPAILTSLLPSRFKPFIQSQPERNLIIVDAPAGISNDIIARLRELDQPVPQVELEAIVCVVAPDSGFRFGLDWGHVVGVDGVDSLKAGLTGLTFSGSASPKGFNDSFSDFAVTSAFVRLLAQEGYITIRAAPRVTAKDGEKANISINRETFFSLQPSSSNVFFQQSVQKVEAGISLEITPRVHGDMVSVNIGKAEVSEDIRTSEARSELTSNPYPIINRRVVSTNVNVRDGHTIVIGGLVQSQTVDRINRIPGLSKIPVFGNMFKTIEKQKQDAEVAIFICPRIVQCDCGPTP